MELRTLGIAALLVSLGVGMASNLLFLAAFQFRLDWLLEPTRILGAGETSAWLLRWASVLDLFGYYLATGVLAYVLWRILRPRNPTVADLATLGALGFALIGGAGAAVMAKVGPMLMTGYTASTSPGEQAIIAAQFAFLFGVVWRSIWQFLDGILLAAWWLGLGILVRADQVGLARLSYGLGALAGIFSVLNAVGVALARDAVLGLAFTLWTAWSIWLLALFLRGAEPFGPETARG